MGGVTEVADEDGITDDDNADDVNEDVEPCEDEEDGDGDDEETCEDEEDDDGDNDVEKLGVSSPSSMQRYV